MSYRIVIAEDEPDIRSNLARLLQVRACMRVGGGGVGVGGGGLCVGACL